MRSSRDNLTERVGNERATPESKITFPADAIGCGYEDSVQRSVSAHGMFPSPCRKRLIPPQLFKPPDRGWIKNDLCSLDRIDSRRFRIPLVITDQRGHNRLARTHLDVAQITGREIVLLVVVGIVRDMHLAIFARHFSARVENERRVIELSVVAFFVDRASDQLHKI